MRRNELILAGFVFALGALVVTYVALDPRPAKAGIAFNGTTSYGRIWRTATNDTPLDPNGTIYSIAARLGAAPAAAQNLYHESDGNNYNSRRLAITRTTAGKISVLYDATGAPDSNDTLVDPNLANLITVWAGPKSLTDPNAKISVWLNGYAVKTSSITTVAISDANMHTISFGTAAGGIAGPFTGEIENMVVVYAADPNTAAAYHTARWNSGNVLDPNAVDGYTYAHRWKLSGGTPSAPVVTTDIWIDDSGSTGGMDCNLTTVDANYPTYTAQFGLFPTTLIVADSNNVSFNGPCVGPWTGGLTYAITGDANWTVTPLDANHTWWSATDASGSGAGTAEIALTEDANALGFGEYTSTIVFTNTDTGGLGSTTRDLTLTVYDGNAIALTDPNHSTGYTWTFPYASAGDANQFVTGVTNGAACEVVINVSSDDPNWTLSGVDPNFCTADGSGGYDCNMASLDNMAVTLELDPNVSPTMPIGSWASNLTFKADEDANHWTVIPLTVMVTTGSVADPNTRVWTWTESADPNDVDPNTHTVNFTNTGATGNIVFGFTDPNTLNLITIDSICTLNPGVGIVCPVDQDANVLVTLAVDPNYGAGVSAGTHDFMLNIYPEGDANAPTTVPMQLDVSASAGGVTRYVNGQAGAAGNWIGGVPNDCLLSEFPCGTLDYVYDVVQANGGGDTVITAGGFTAGLTIDGTKSVAFTYQTTGPTVTSSTADLLTVSNSSDGDVSFNGFTFTPATSKRIATGANGGTGDPNLAFTNCDFALPSSYAPTYSAFYLITTNGDTETLAFTDCNVTAPDQTAVDFLLTNNQTSVTLDGLSLPSTGYACRDLFGVGVATTVTVQNCTGTVNRSIVQSSTGAVVGTLIIRDNQLSSTATSGAGWGSLLHWGDSSSVLNAPALTIVTDNTFDGHNDLIYLRDPNGNGNGAIAYVTGNTLTGSSNGAASHGIGPFDGLAHANVAYNTVDFGTDPNSYGIVLKCDGGKAYGNVARARFPLSITGGKTYDGSESKHTYGITAVHNSLYVNGASGKGVAWTAYTDDATAYPLYWVLTDNIISAGGYTGAYALYSNSASPTTGFYLGECDRNKYVKGSSNLAYFDTIGNVTTLAGLNDASSGAWVTKGNLSGADENSELLTGASFPETETGASLTRKNRAGAVPAIGGSKKVIGGNGESRIR